jgi:DNA polymerase II large subunit
MNKHIIVIALIVVVTVAAYFFLLKGDTTPPITNDTEPTTEVEQGAEDANVDQDTDTEPVAEETNSDYVGMSVADAQAKAEAEDTLFRVVMEDGESLPTTKDYRPGRINATVESGVVTEYSVEGSEAMETEPAGDHDEIIGMTTEEAQAYADANDVPFRTGSIDGEAMAVTMDYRPGRITADIVDGVVTGYTVE